MSHNIKHSSFKVSLGEKGKKQCEKEWNEYVKRETWKEGGNGLYSPIRWIDFICDSLEDAEKYIEEHDNGWYDQLAVKYRQVPSSEIKSSKLTNLLKQLETARQRINNLSQMNYFENHKSAFLGCKTCLSKISQQYLTKRYYCPVCGNDMRSETHLERLKKAKENVSSVQNAIEEERKYLYKKSIKKAELYWLVKIEYHT